MCSPVLLADPARPLRVAADLRHHTLLTLDLPEAPPTVDWEPWLQLMGVDAVQPSSTVRFTRYSEAVEAAVAGQGIVIGRLPLLAGLLRDGRLVAPFRTPAASRRGYFVEQPARAAGNPHAQDFVRWLVAEAAAS